MKEFLQGSGRLVGVGQRGCEFVVATRAWPTAYVDAWSIRSVLRINEALCNALEEQLTKDLLESRFERCKNTCFDHCVPGDAAELSPKRIVARKCMGS